MAKTDRVAKSIVAPLAFMAQIVWEAAKGVGAASLSELIGMWTAVADRGWPRRGKVAETNGPSAQRLAPCTV